MMYDYDLYNINEVESSFGMLFGGIYLYIIIIWMILSIIGMWKLFNKAGYAGWKSLIPIYNLWILFEISGMKGIYVLLLWVPILNIILEIFMNIKLAKSFGKGVLFVLGLLLFNPLFMLILGLDNSIYKG